MGGDHLRNVHSIRFTFSGKEKLDHPSAEYKEVMGGAEGLRRVKV